MAEPPIGSARLRSRAQGAEADKAAYAVYEAGQKRQEEKTRQHEVLLSQVPDEEAA